MKTALSAAAVALLLFVGTAQAQFACGTCGADGCMCVHDGPVEANTGVIADSVTAPGGAGIWRPASSYLDQLSGHLGLNVTGTLHDDYPGEDLLPPDTMPIVEKMVGDAMNVYYNAWDIADEIEGNMDDDDSALANIEQINQSLGAGGAGLLAATQLVVESNLHIAQELQYSNELAAVQIKMHAVEHAENLDERAQAHATEATARNWGILPQ